MCIRDSLHTGRHLDTYRGRDGGRGGRFLCAIEKGAFPDGQKPFVEEDTCVAVVGEGEGANSLHAAGDRQGEGRCV